jgi:glutamate synthase (NADPH/NADH) small chain
MDFLTQQNRIVAGDNLGATQIRADGKRVVVIGGGDTGSDCIGTSNRHRAKSIVNFEIFPKPPMNRTASQPWPFWPNKVRTSSSHEEGCERVWSILTKEFIGSEGYVEKVKTVNIEFVPSKKGGPSKMKEIPGSEKEWPADLVLLAMGFSGPEKEGLVAQLDLQLDERGNIKTNDKYMTNKPGIFAAGDMRRGQSLVVWAISEGREAAFHVDSYLMGNSTLPLKGQGDLPRI